MTRLRGCHGSFGMTWGPVLGKKQLPSLALTVEEGASVQLLWGVFLTLSTMLLQWHDPMNFYDEEHSTVYILHFPYLFICSWTGGWFHILSIVNNVSRNVGFHLSLQYTDFICLKCILSGGITTANDSCILFFEQLPTIFHSVHTDLNSTLHCVIV